jgi:hypothetical protein
LALFRSAPDLAQKKSAHAAEQQRPDILKRREAWFESQLDLDPKKLVFIDETWASTNMARRYGRAPKGERLRAAVPHGHWKTTTFVAGLRLDGLVAPFVFDGPINALTFEAYVEQFLVPELKPGDIVVMDNLSSHKRPKVRALVEAAGASLLYLPPYSPDYSLSSKPCCEKPPSGPSTASGGPSANVSTNSPGANAPTTSRPQAMSQPERKPL